MKHKKEIVLSVSILAIALFGLCFNSVFAATLDEANSSAYGTAGASVYQSRVDIQGDAVYEDASGSTDYAVFITASNWFWTTGYSTKTYAYIYVSAHYYYEYDSGIGNYNIWDAVDTNLISWEGDYVFDHDGESWEWWVDSNEYYCNGNDETTTSSCSTSYSASGSDQGTWQLLGYFYVYKAANRHKYDALLKLQIDNSKAEEYIEGRRYYDPDDGWYTETISEIRIKMYFKFYFYSWWAWHLDKTQTHILGDGVGAGDLASIPLVEGTVDGLQ